MSNITKGISSNITKWKTPEILTFYWLRYSAGHLNSQSLNRFFSEIDGAHLSLLHSRKIERDGDRRWGGFLTWRLLIPRRTRHSKREVDWGAENEVGFYAPWLIIGTHGFSMKPIHIGYQDSSCSSESTMIEMAKSTWFPRLLQQRRSGDHAVELWPSSSWKTQKSNPPIPWDHLLWGRTNPMTDLLKIELPMVTKNSTLCVQGALSRSFWNIP